MTCAGVNMVNTFPPIIVVQYYEPFSSLVDLMKFGFHVFRLHVSVHVCFYFNTTGNF